MGKWITISLLSLFALFVLIGIWLAIKNDFSSDVQKVFLKVTGAVALALYLLADEFLIKKIDVFETRVPIPVFHNFISGEVFTPFRITIGMLPQEANFFIGLKEFNSRMTYNTFQRLRQTPEVFGPERYDYLEYIFFAWLEENISYKMDKRHLAFTHNGHGGGTSFKSEKTPMSKVNLKDVEPKNPFFVADPLVLNLPRGSKVKRIVEEHVTKYEIISDTGSLNINFTRGGGGLFQAVLDTALIRNMANVVRSMYSVPQETDIENQLSVNYPTISLSYTPFKSSKFSNQTRAEEEWVRKLSLLMFKDFSWDLLREYYSFGFPRTLDLYRSHPENKLKNDF